MQIFSSDEHRECEILRYTGVPILTVNMFFPKDGFFAELGGNAYLWAKETLFSELCREYDASDDPRKRFDFGYSYKYVCRPCFSDGEFVSYKIHASVASRNGRKIFAKHTLGVVVRESDGELMPPEMFMDRRARRRYRKLRAESFYLSERGVCAILPDKSEICLCENAGAE